MDEKIGVGFIAVIMIALGALALVALSPMVMGNGGLIDNRGMMSNEFEDCEGYEDCPFDQGSSLEECEKNYGGCGEYRGQYCCQEEQISNCPMD